MKAIRALHPGDPSIGGREHADSPWLVAFNNDTGPVTYFVYDPAAPAGGFCSARGRNWTATSSRRWSRSASPRGTG